MKQRFTILFAVICVMLMGGMLLAQNAPIDFEAGGHGANWTWNVFENDTNPPLEIIANPDPSGANTSATVAKFTALQTGNPWAGCESMHGSDIGTFTLTADNSIVKIMVWKPVISDVGIKFARADGSALPEIKVANTVINQWEELTFDFSGRIGDPNTIDQDQIIVFPDFDLNGRTQDNVCYFDNITFSAGGGTGSEPTVAAPTPTHPETNVLSIYSDAYTNVPGTNFNPNWGQATVVTVDYQVAGNNTLKYENLNYQGTEFTAQDVSGYDYLHIDFWTTSSAQLDFYLISPGPLETFVGFSLPVEEWNSYDIPLSAFTPPVNLSEVFQFKVVGEGTVYFDNWYFWKASTDITEIDNAVPTEFALEQNYPNPFNPSTSIRFSLPLANQVQLKVYNMLGQEVATLLNEFKNAGSYEVSFDAANLPSGVYVYAITAGSFSAVKKMMLLK